MTNATILVVQDGGAGTRQLEECLQRLGYTVCATVSSTREAIGKAPDLSPDVALIDLAVDGCANGPEAAERIASRFHIPVVCLTNDTASNPFPPAPTVHPFAYVLKPFDERQLNWNIQTVLSQSEREGRHRKARNRLKRRIDEMQSRIDLMEIVFDSMEEGVVAVDECANTLVVNSGAVRMGGIHERTNKTYEWASMHGVYCIDQETLLPVDENPLVLAMRGKMTNGVELFVRNEQMPEGVFISVNGRPLKDNPKGQRGGVVVFQDITRKKETEFRLEETINNLREQGELLQTVFDSIQDGIVVGSDSGEFMYGNPRAKEILGEEYAIRRQDNWWEQAANVYSFTDRVTPVKVEDLPLPRAILNGESVDDQVLFLKQPGQATGGSYIRFSARPLRDEFGGIRGGVMTCHDVTDQMYANEELTQAFARGRLEVVETILHNIGNAINSVTVGIETLHGNISDDRLLRRLVALADAVKAHEDDWPDYIRHDPQGRNAMPFLIALANDFVRQNGTAKRIINRVRDRARHIADIVRSQNAWGNANVTRKDVNLRKSIEGAVKLVVDSLETKVVWIRVDCAEAPREIRIQESQFHQMLVNLIKNSLEAIDDLSRSNGIAETPSVQIHAYVDGEFLNIDVIDNGIGFARNDPQSLFASGYTTKEGGTGLGLHSAANFVVGSGGQIELVSDGIGKGATTRVRLRLSSVVSFAVETGQRR